ncbi:MAG TPA: hypothetical protein VJ499_12925 [Flavisolibacter sp.]|nr:hypothetical protein [Flavisolibacter sp.]
MNKYALAALLFIVITGCKKDPVDQPIPGPVHPVMLYKDLKNYEVSKGHSLQLDLDNDGITDCSFSVQLVGDPIMKVDKLQYYVFSRIKRNLLNDLNDESPVLSKFELIKNVHPGYTWYELSSIVLTQKIISDAGNSWIGLWKNADHKYLPFQVVKDGNLFHGWIEISMNTVTEKLVLHRSGISTEANKEVKAGY